MRSSVLRLFLGTSDIFLLFKGCSEQNKLKRKDSHSEFLGQRREKNSQISLPYCINSDMLSRVFYFILFLHMSVCPQVCTCAVPRGALASLSLHLQMAVSCHTQLRPSPLEAQVFQAIEHLLPPRFIFKFMANFTGIEKKNSREPKL